MRISLLGKLFLPALTFLFVAGTETARAQARGGRSGAGGASQTGGVRTVGGPSAGPRVIVNDPIRTRRIPVDDFPTTRRRPDDVRDRRRPRVDDVERRPEPRRLGDRDTERLQKLARYLGASPERLHSFYQTSKEANPDLRPREFLTALVVANDLQDSHPEVTSQALLRGLASGHSIEQTLGGLGLRPAEVREALKHAKRVIEAFTP